MDLRLTTEQLALRAEAAAFCESVRPLLEADPEWRRQGLLSDGDSREVTRELGRAGWIGLPWPVEFGGRGLTNLDAALAENERRLISGGREPPSPLQSQRDQAWQSEQSR